MSWTTEDDHAYGEEVNTVAGFVEGESIEEHLSKLGAAIEKVNKKHEEEREKIWQERQKQEQKALLGNRHERRKAAAMARRKK